jgi:hypothetical protein
MIQEELPNMCLWNATILVLIFLYPNATFKQVVELTEKRSVSQ